VQNDKFSKQRYLHKNEDGSWKMSMQMGDILNTLCNLQLQNITAIINWHLAECNSGRILKIDQLLPKLRA